MKQDEIYLRMDPMDVQVLRAWDEGGLHAAARALRSQTVLGTKYRHRKALEVLEHMLREPPSTGECLEALMSLVPSRAWTSPRRSLLREFLAGTGSMHHLCRRQGRKINEGVYIRSRLRAALSGDGLPPSVREWLRWRLAMPSRYPGMDGVRVTARGTIGSLEALSRLAGTEGMSLAAAGRHLGVNENTVRKWRARAAGLPGL